MKTCNTCGKEYAEKTRTQKYCSHKCRDEMFKTYSYQKGHGKGDSGYQWKGDDASYITKHVYVLKWKGKATKCEHCGEEGRKRYNWANVDHKYSRNLDDYIALCVPCHRKYDLKFRTPPFDVAKGKEMKERGMSYRAIARHFGIGCHNTIKFWLLIN